MKLLFLILCLCTAPGLVRAQDEPSPREKKLMEDLQRLEARVAALESRLAQPASSTPQSTPPAVTTSTARVPTIAPTPEPQPAPPSDILSGTTLNGTFDGYYAFNFNRPIGRDNLLRAYDVSSNSFSLNQADLIVENAPDPAKGKRWGARLDLQFGQATQTLQGNPANEPRPDIYRNVFQAYGTYVFPAGQGLTLDFGKWSSSIGIEGNYTKDQINYSRSFWFDYLPFYHTGLRAAWKLSDQVTLNYWMTNGTQQTEAFNNFKDQLLGFNVTPRKNVNLVVNYYLGQEHPDVIFYNSSAVNSPPPPANLPTLQGVPFSPIPSPPTGHLHIFDSYASWQPSSKLSLALEGDYVIERVYNNSAPSHTDGGALYARYQLTPKFAFAGRSEYLSDRGGLYTGTNLALREATLTLERKLAEGFLIRTEWRRDWANQPYFLTPTLGILKKEQETATVGVVWWFGQKTGIW